MSLTYGELFAGIGGMSLGLERAGWTPRWFVENDDYCRKVLAKHWPDMPCYGDICDVDFTEVEPVDLIAGGFPCQPVSHAGRRKGQDDERWLWPHFARAVRDLRPRYVLVENVPGLTVRGMGDVVGDLAALGYDAEWESIPAAAVGAPHLRWRVFIVAYWPKFSRTLAHAGSGRRQVVEVPAGRDESRLCGPSLADADGEGQLQQGRTLPQERGRLGNGSSSLANPADWRRQRGRTGPGEAEGRRTFRIPPRPSRAWSSEPDVGRVAHGIPHRVDRLKALGNAVVPQVAEYVARRIIEHAEVTA